MNPPPKWWQKGGFFVAELVILVLGIMISFMLNEWRLSAKKAADRTFILEQFRHDLAGDTTRIGQEILMLEKITESSTRLLMHRDQIPVDSLGYYIGLQLNVLSLNASQSAYLETLGTGRQQIVENDSLLTRLLYIYNQLYPNLDSWSEIDQKMVMDQFFPFFHNRFPFALNFNFGMVDDERKRNALEVINSDTFMNLVQSSLIIKSSELYIYRQVRAYLTETLKILDKELEGRNG